MTTLDPAPNATLNGTPGATLADDLFDQLDASILDVAAASTLPPELYTAPEVLAFEQQAARLQRAMLGANSAAGEALTRIGLLERALNETPNAAARIRQDLRALQNSVREIQWALNGDPTIALRRESTPPSLTGRLRRFTGGWGDLLHEVTGFHREQYDIVAGEFGGILSRLRQLVEVDLKQIEDAAEAAGAPWTSGRIPNWRP